MKKINLRDLKQYLNQKSKVELINEISDLFGKFENVKNYYTTKINPDNAKQVLQKFKDIIKKEFFPSRGYGNAKLSVARKAISDFKKVTNSKKELADIMLFYVEMGVEYTNTYGDINESFYTSMESMYEKVLKYIFDQGLQDQFIDRCEEIVKDTSDIGWGFHDTLSDTYYEYFEEDK